MPRNHRHHLSILHLPLELIRVQLAFETKSQYRSSLSSICRKISLLHPRQSPHLPSPQLQLPSLLRPPMPSAQSPRAPASQISTPAFRPPPLECYRTPGCHSSPTTQLGTGSGILASQSTPHSHHPQLTVWAQLLSGGFARLVGQTASYPFEVIRRRIRFVILQKRKQRTTAPRHDKTAQLDITSTTTQRKNERLHADPHADLRLVQPPATNSFLGSAHCCRGARLDPQRGTILAQNCGRKKSRCRRHPPRHPPSPIGRDSRRGRHRHPRHHCGRKHPLVRCCGQCRRRRREALRRSRRRS
jgi:Mitochondrial carrier protein